MTQQAKQSRNNLTIECLRMAAAFFVVMIHVPFPGLSGELVTALARFAVPLFFAVSGYFSFRASDRKLCGRFFYVLKLNLIAAAAVIAWRCLAAVCQGGSVIAALRACFPTVKGIASWLFLHIHPYGGHLWYLAAICLCYGVLCLYTRFFGERTPDYRPLYILAAALLAIRFAVSDMLRIIGYSIPYSFCRDGWFVGLPMFAIGLFIREHQDTLLRSFSLTTRRLLLLLVVSIGLTLLQWRAFGTGELPFGAMLQVFPLLLLASLHPGAGVKSPAAVRMISSFSFLSTWVYILHLCVDEAYVLFLQPATAALTGGVEPWLRPLLVILLSVLVSLALRFLLDAAKRLARRRAA